MEKIGRYKIVSELGRGGMATVYQAVDPSFERDVAIKVLPQAFLHDPQFRTRFEREAKMVAALEHAAIVPVYDFGEDNGVPFIVMRLMSGGSLADKIKDDKLTVEEAAQIVTRVATALDAAHKKGIIHRDLKPGNILFDQYNNAFLSDFGIARLAEGGATLTGSNILGTPAYMSPEQVQGEGDLDGRSDIYSLGVLFYQMLAGNTPYRATTPAKVMMMHILEPVPNLMAVLPNVSSPIKAWFETALAKDPKDRFSTAGEMAIALRSAMQGEVHPTIQARVVPSSPSSDLSKTIAGAPATVVTPARGMQAITTPPPNTPPPTAVPVAARPEPSGIRWLPIVMGGLVVIGIIGIGIIALVFLGISNRGPLAAILAQVSATPTVTVAPPTDTLEVIEPTDTLAPTDTEAVVVVVPTDTPQPTDTPEPVTNTLEPPTDTPEPTLTPTLDVTVIGGADAIAFVDKNEVWLMNIDGSDWRQLTFDGAEKTRLSWTPDGTSILYISGKCIWSIEYESERQDILACFETASSIEDFSVSADGDQVAIVLNQELFVVPFDRERLAQARFRSDLVEMSECEVLAPLKSSTGSSIAVNQVRWSADGTRMAINVIAPIGGLQADLIRFTDVSNCAYTDVLDEFPSRRLEIDGYDKTPIIQNFGYDGYVVFSLVSYTRNDGFGHLYFYNTDLHRAENQVDPIDDACCYRDPQFSPDGRYLIFAYQPYQAGATTQLYYVPYATIGTGANFEPIPLPDTFLTDPKAKPQPALRPASNP